MTAVIADPSEGGAEILVADFQLAPEHATTRSAIGSSDAPVQYLLEFSYPAGSTAIGGACTLGVSTGEKSSDLEQVMRAADDNMYREKRGHHRQMGRGN